VPHPVTFDLDIDVRTTATTERREHLKRLLDAATQGCQERHRQSRSAATAHRPSRRWRRQRAGAKIVTNMRDVYKERIATYAAQYGKTPRGSIVNAFPRKSGDRGGAVFWDDVEAGLRTCLGTEWHGCEEVVHQHIVIVHRSSS
jgi:hypothetical protein